MEEREEPGRPESQDSRSNSVGTAGMPAYVVKTADGLPQGSIAGDREYSLAEQVAEDTLTETVAANQG